MVSGVADGADWAVCLGSAGVKGALYGEGKAAKRHHGCAVDKLPHHSAAMFVRC